jgi:hypothetical protein
MARRRAGRSVPGMPSTSRQRTAESRNELLSLASFMTILLVTNVVFFATVMPYQ